jgi:LCP family protein required for cell wall assembly
MARWTWKRVTAGFLSMLVPGAGQVYAGARRRGAVLLAVSAALTVVLVALLVARPLGLAASVVDRRVVAAILLANLALLGFRLFAVVDAWRLGRAAASGLAIAGLAVVAAATAAPHVAAGYVTVRGYDVLDTVFADEEPRDVLGGGALFISARPVRPLPVPRRPWPLGIDPTHDQPAPLRLNPARAAPLAASPDVLGTAVEPSEEQPWTTILLLGSDEGPGQPGDRTDTMIVVALQQSTGRAAAFGIPRNLVEVPLGEKLGRFREPLNHLYRFGVSRPELFPGGHDAGATALKQGISRLLGLRLDYYALVDLQGFADLVDALGGVDVHVKERIVDEVTRPAWGEPKPTIDVHPGRTYHFFGREALAYVRSRKTSNDYSRMARQRCFLSAMAQQLDVVSVLRNFGSLATTVKASVSTDIPLARLPELIRLAAAVDSKKTLTETFGVEYFARRRAVDNFPVPDLASIQGTVREAILLPPQLLASGRLESAAKAC